ncbi:MAG: hypothetical protein WA021_03505 [Minisyncoccia bacterium]
MTARTVLLLTIALLLALSFGGIVHAVLPHDHNHSPVVAERMHAALRFSEEKTVALPFFLTVVTLLLPLLITSRRELSLASLVIRSGSAEMHGLRKGIALYRRFG